MTPKPLVPTSDVAKQPLRPYEPPRLTVLGTAATLTRDQQSQPSGTSGPGDAAHIVFFGDNA